MNGTHEGVSGYMISPGFNGLMDDQRTLEFLGRHCFFLLRKKLTIEI